MTIPDHELVDRARDAASRAYAPYSHFRVGAAVVTASGEVVTGANIENAAFGATVCAETNAITSAIAGGADRIVAVAVVCLDGHPCTPCGNCRQVMREFGVERVLMASGDGPASEKSLEELLPESFGPEALER
jgi:cytidine deaminase